jgi:uncharacterized small protein (DUF1192 family)
MNSVKNNDYYYLPKTTTEKSATTDEKTGDVIVVDEIEVAVKMWDDHIERLEAKLSFLIRSNHDTNLDLLYQYEKKVATLKREINDAMEQRQTFIGRSKLVLLGNPYNLSSK